ncbi:unnamed protein product, partial [Mesorhabditis belari]|uniref:Uncharacterized protein n=1 Tax=Mesorhabditis belari TaxID=2138241 RepID=A0AAF3FPZ1_9BILA
MKKVESIIQKFLLFFFIEKATVHVVRGLHFLLLFTSFVLSWIILTVHITVFRQYHKDPNLECGKKSPIYPEILTQRYKSFYVEIFVYDCIGVNQFLAFNAALGLILEFTCWLTSVLTLVGMKDKMARFFFVHFGVLIFARTAFLIVFPRVSMGSHLEILIVTAVHLGVSLIVCTYLSISTIWKRKIKEKLKLNSRRINIAVLRFPTE